jgi:Mrp family chromosome partitioning ATPase
VARPDTTADLAVVRNLTSHWFVALVALGVCLAMGAAAALLPEKSYEATSTVSVEPTTGQQASTGVQTINFLIPAFIERIESRPFRSRAAEGLPAGVADAPVTVKGSAESGTGVIAITVGSTNRAATAAWANALAERLLAEEAPTATPAPEPAPSPGSTTTTTVQVLDLALINPAATPSAPSSPQVLPLLVGSALLGLLAAVFATQVAARLRQARDLPEQLRTRLGVPVLGEIPFMWRWRRRPVPAGQLLDDSPQRLEALKRLRVNVQLAMLDQQPSAVAVASTAVGEGKSTMTVAIGASLASVGHDVTLIDADLRRPTLHTRTERPLRPGLADLRPGAAAELRQPTGLEGLSVITAGVPDGHPADVVATKVPAALEELGAPGSLLLVDCPPLHLAAESRQMVAQAGFVILVARARKVKLERLEKLVDDLRSARVVVLGVVLNRTGRGSQPKQYYGSTNPGATPGAVAEPTGRAVAPASADR